MAMSDLVGTIRRLDFPASVQTAVDHLGRLFNKGDAGIPGLGSGDDEIAESIATEFIFRETGKHGAKKTTAMQKLQVLEIVMGFYRKEDKGEWVQNSVFKSMFNGNLSPARTDFLAKLVSMAIGLKNKAILDCSAVWMQYDSSSSENWEEETGDENQMSSEIARHGCCTEVVAVVVSTVVNDYCHLVPNAASGLTVLPQLSPHFCCNFITALTTFYIPSGTPGTRRTLPPELLDLLTDWVEQDPRLCLVSLCHAQNAFIQPQRSSLWTSPTKPNTQTPIPGLVKWTTQTLVGRRLMLFRQSNSATNGHSQTVPEITPQERKTWSRLHLALLQTLLAFPTLPGANQLELLTLADMSRIVKDVSISIAEMTRHKKKSAVKLDAELQTAINRLVQVLQVALTTGSFRCSLSDLQSICNNIPSNKLLQILENQHLARTPPPMHYESR